MAITKTELIASIASATGESRASVARIIDGMSTAVTDAVARGEKVTIPGFLTVEQVATAARTGRNPATGQEIKIPAGTRIKITAGTKLKAAGK